MADADAMMRTQGCGVSHDWFEYCKLKKSSADVLVMDDSMS